MHFFCLILIASVIFCRGIDFVFIFLDSREEIDFNELFEVSAFFCFQF
jgi:hypothetical protein